MKKAKLYIISFCFPLNTIIIISLLLTNCTNYSTYKTEIISSSKPNNFTKDSINSINIFLETSKSMKGYINRPNIDDSGYVLYKLIRYLNTDCKTQFEEPNIYTISNKVEQYKGRKGLFFRMLKNRNLMKGSSTPIHNIFKSILNLTKKHDISILITDCVFDIGNNVGEKISITTDLYETLSRQPNLSTSVFQYYSEFDGDWYYDRRGYATPFRNNDIVLHNRPLYVWIIGNPGLVKLILESNILSDFENNYSYGIPYAANIDFKILKGTTYGKIAISEKGKTYKIIDISKDNPCSFVMGIDLSSYPYFIKNKAYLQNNLKFSDEYLNSNKITIYDKKSIKFVSNYSRIAPLLDKYDFTHFIKLTFNKLDNDFDLILIDREPEWIINTHLEDDYNLNAIELQGQTYGLKYITNAFKDRYNRNDNTFFKIHFFKTDQ
jgi:hypothetical protein